MNVTRANLLQLFDRNIRHVVPLFQRPYVWKQDRQWKPLWTDVTNKADEFLEYRKQGGAEPTKHFLGAVVLNPMLFHGFQIPAELVIDGQQRLTTMQLVLIALRDYATHLDHQRVMENLEYLVKNHGSMDQEFERYKVWPTNADQKVFEDVFKASSPQALEQIYPLVKKSWRHKYYEPRPLLVEAYLFFYNSIKAYASAGEDRQNGNDEAPREVQIARLDALERALMNYMEIVKIDLDEKDNPQVIFETLNYRGEPLAPSDLIRNFVFLEVRNQKKSDQQLYDQYWLPYDQAGLNNAPNSWKHLESSGRYYYPRMDLFIFHYLVLRTGKDISIGRLYQEFTTWWNQTRPDVETELQQLQYYSQIYHKFYQPDLLTRAGQFELRLRILEVTTIYPVLMFMLGTCKDEIPPVELDGILTDLESFLIRRAVCNLTVKNYNNFFLTLLSNLKNQRPITRAKVQELLLASKVDTARWPDDSEFHHHWMEEPVYRNMRNRVRVILEALDRAQCTALQEPVTVDYNFTSVEHILPQAWQTYHPLPPDAAPETIVERHIRVQTLGNLTLLTQALNSSVSNGPFSEKRPAIAVQSLLKLNSYFQNIPDHWVENDIWNRGLKLFETARAVWPHP